jgi:REP element-mobilizing transposase RayT
MFIRHRQSQRSRRTIFECQKVLSVSTEWRPAFHRRELLSSRAVARGCVSKRFIRKSSGTGAATLRICGVGYVVMPEHFHLLISEPEKANPSVVIQALKLGVVRRLFPTPDSSAPNHFWQRRFYDFNVWTAHKHREKLRYIHRNPVKRGQIETPDQWRWSSFRAYAFDETGPVVVNDWSTVKMKVRAA